MPRVFRIYEPGGLSTPGGIKYYSGNRMFLYLGADIVEYNPTRDIKDMTGMVCAKLVKEIASKMIENNP